jgi:hypothetical protein
MIRFCFLLDTKYLRGINVNKKLLRYEGQLGVVDAMLRPSPSVFRPSVASEGCGSKLALHRTSLGR